MARLHDDQGDDAVLFERTGAQWRALGAPASLYDQHAAAKTWLRVGPAETHPPYTDPRKALVATNTRDDLPLPNDLPEALLAAVDSRVRLAWAWWAEVRPYFLMRVQALTTAEVSALQDRPDRYRPQHLPTVVLDAELFPDHSAPARRPATKRRPRRTTTTEDR